MNVRDDNDESSLRHMEESVCANEDSSRLRFLEDRQWLQTIGCLLRERGTADLLRAQGLRETRRKLEATLLQEAGDRGRVLAGRVGSMNRIFSFPRKRFVELRVALTNGRCRFELITFLGDI